jgi:6,7-dimethyl-8-ribityllumazine synthase
MGRDIEGQLDGRGLRFGIAVARFNELITSQLLAGARDGLRRHGVADADVDVAWVPGSLELPLVAQSLARSGRYDAVICRGRSFAARRPTSISWPAAWPRGLGGWRSNRGCR